MNFKQNLHTHSVYCDGKDTLEGIILTAIEKGFDSIGFSSHSYMKYATYRCLTPESTEEYINEINELRLKYADKIKIYCGIEYEFDSEVDLKDFNYTIGAVHTLKLDGIYYDVDWTLKRTENVINKFFDGNGLRYAKAYYERLAELPKQGRFDILAHFDLVSKFQDKKELFDEDSKEYKYAVTEAIESLKGKIPYFEVNTGAISRGYRKMPYPSPYIVKELRRLGFGAVITSDCHNKDCLDCGFDIAERLLLDCGFKERYVLTDNGFKPIIIK